jgi:hypothetical protein
MADNPHFFPGSHTILRFRAFYSDHHNSIPMRTLFATLAVLVSCHGFAQHHAGLSFGSSFSGISGKTSTDQRLKPGLTAVAHYQFDFDRLILQGAIDYTQKGYREKIAYTDANANIVHEGYVNYRFDYLGVSLKAGVRYGNRLFGYTTLGITPSYLLLSEYRTEKVVLNGNTIPAHREKLYNVSSFDLSLGLETTVGYVFAHRSSVFLTTGVNRGLYDVYTYGIVGSSDWKNHYISARIGCQFVL